MVSRAGGAAMKSISPSPIRTRHLPRMNRIQTRGQLYSSDALLSIVIFLFAMTIISALTQQLQSQSADEHQNYVTTQRTARAALTLFTSPGNPAHWDTNSDRNAVWSVGVSTHGAEISSQKWNAFLDWNATDYPDLARRLGIGDLNFLVTISDVNKNILTQAGIGPVDKNQVSVVTLPVVYESQGAIATLQVYSD